MVYFHSSCESVLFKNRKYTSVFNKKRDFPYKVNHLRAAAGNTYHIEIFLILCIQFVLCMGLSCNVLNL